MSIWTFAVNLLAEAEQPAPGGGGGGGGGGLGQMLPLIVIMVIVFYFTILRPQKRDQAKREQQLRELKKNDRVVTIGGIIGTIANISPNIPGEGLAGVAHLNGSAGWGDAAVIVPWELYRAYGDTRILAESWPTIVAWLDRVGRAARTQRHPDRAAARPTPAPTRCTSTPSLTSATSTTSTGRSSRPTPASSS